MKSPYFDTIRTEIARQGYIGVDPRHVEAFMRVEHPTLDGLSKTQFAAEVNVGIQCAREDAANAERVAQSFGF